MLGRVSDQAKDVAESHEGFVVDAFERLADQHDRCCYHDRRDPTRSLNRSMREASHRP
jgi:hypothetical protein